MKKVTKRPKKVKVFYEKEKIESYQSKYICPSCKVVFHGFGPAKNVLRFICKCGQELIVENKPKKKE